MAVAALVSVEEYLSTDYSPDCDYVDGVLEDRNVGEKDHSKLQRDLTVHLYARCKELGLHLFPEQRVQVTSTRFRVPDLCITIGEPDEQIFTAAPFLCIEVLSKDDRAEDIQEKVEEYLAFGVGYIWIINHRKRLAYVHTGSGTTKAEGGVLKTSNPDIIVPLAEVWPKWKR